MQNSTNPIEKQDHLPRLLPPRYRVQFIVSWIEIDLLCQNGYGGGTWTYHEISEEEKARMGRLEREHFSNTDDAEVLPRYPEH